MTKENYTHLTLVVDRSGSMTSVLTDAQSGIDTLLEEQFALDLPFTLSLIEFDTEISNVATMTKSRPEYKLKPRGFTALFDAIGKGITQTGAHLRALPEDERPGTVLFVIVTDGYENASREYSGNAIKKLVEEQREKYNWQFQFIGADESALQGQALGFNTTSYDPTTSSGVLYASASASLTNTRSTGAEFIMPETIGKTPDSSNV